MKPSVCKPLNADAPPKHCLSELLPSHANYWVFPLVSRFHLWGWILADDSLDLGLVRSFVPFEQVVRLSLGWGIWVWVVEEILHAEQDLLDGNGRLPSLLLVQDREADGPGWVDVRMEERWDELALWWLGGVFCRIQISHSLGDNITV